MQNVGQACLTPTGTEESGARVQWDFSFENNNLLLANKPVRRVADKKQRRDTAAEHLEQREVNLTPTREKLA